MLLHHFLHPPRAFFRNRPIRSARPFSTIFRIRENIFLKKFEKPLKCRIFAGAFRIRGFAYVHHIFVLAIDTRKEVVARTKRRLIGNKKNTNEEDYGVVG